MAVAASTITKVLAGALGGAVIVSILFLRHESVSKSDTLAEMYDEIATSTVSTVSSSTEALFTDSATTTAMASETTSTPSLMKTETPPTPQKVTPSPVKKPVAPAKNPPTASKQAEAVKPLSQPQQVQENPQLKIERCRVAAKVNSDNFFRELYLDLNKDSSQLCQSETNFFECYRKTSDANQAIAEGRRRVAYDTYYLACLNYNP